MAFVKTIEDFRCAHCDEMVRGSGYTNHCPRCLWSRHVDKDPGDRKASCGGMMKPLRIEGTTEQYRVVHRCEVCGFERTTNVAPDDDIDAILAIVETHAQKN